MALLKLIFGALMLPVGLVCFLLGMVLRWVIAPLLYLLVFTGIAYNFVTWFTVHGSAFVF